MENIVVPVTVEVKDLKAQKDQIVNGALVLEIHLMRVAKSMTDVAVLQIFAVQVVIKKFYPVLIK
jgi:hypothetical protein